MTSSGGWSLGTGCELRLFRAALAVGGLSLIGAAPASASELIWDGPPGCASSEALSFELERVLSGNAGDAP